MDSALAEHLERYLGLTRRLTLIVMSETGGVKSFSSF